MPSLADQIGQYLEQAIAASPGGAIEIQRVELAERFGCAPSQINYVLETRFTAERGYVIESRRGGGGYIRIRKVAVDLSQDLLRLVRRFVGEMVPQAKAEHFIRRLEEAGFVTEREAGMMRAVIDREVIGLELPMRDIVRARLLTHMILRLMQYDKPEKDI